ncbi:gamma carbonic anhydrase family protein [Kaustia mangrovi]|uniref:Gamma carbonic anhydrase family protein n=1 Tax=Kaustia mangrovi TaxID=2593653 RepID=A0A7S8HAC0_9HYPH|nr:gamma carbonic anhydrase family protein [Kaustia mangrovi]QPC41279.1 gamma carbonic anhydrase family protein [Kaustia mangrovi]
MAIYELDGVRPILPEDGHYWIAPSADVVGRVMLERNASVWFGAVLRGDNELIRIGENSNVQDGSVLHTDEGCPLTVGANVTVGHKVILHGCTIADQSLIGMGACILNNARIGRNCIIGAHALIPEGKEIPDNSLVIGMPGRVVRALTPEEVEGLALSAEHYVANWQRYSRGVRALV